MESEFYTKTLVSGTEAVVATLKALVPLSSMSDRRLREIADLCTIESVERNAEPFRQRAIAGQSVYLLRGELVLEYGQGVSEVIVGRSADAYHPLGKRRMFISAKAVTEVQLLRVDDKLLDLVLTWDQLAGHEHARAPRPLAVESPNGRSSAGTDWGAMPGLFGINKLRYGAFSELPPAHIEELLRRFERVEAKRGDVIIREGAEGDYYYLVESGRCLVERKVGGVSITLAELRTGDAFGEEALVSDAKRNATITMKTDGRLLRLSKQDFNALLREPLLREISLEQARQKVLDGAVLIDVRYVSEYQYDRLSGAINIPLFEIRNAFGALDINSEYVVYCQNGRRSSAAAFLLAQRGYRVYLLAGGLWGGGRLPG